MNRQTDRKQCGRGSGVSAGSPARGRHHGGGLESKSGPTGKHSSLCLDLSENGEVSEHRLTDSLLIPRKEAENRLCDPHPLAMTHFSQARGPGTWKSVS